MTHWKPKCQILRVNSYIGGLMIKANGLVSAEGDTKTNRIANRTPEL